MKFEEWQKEVARLQEDVTRANETLKRSQEHLAKFIHESVGVNLGAQQIGIDQIAILASKVFDMRKE